MKKLNPDQKKMMDRAIQFAPTRQKFMFLLWRFFNHRRSDKLIKCISVGMTWEASYIIAYNFNY